jgi:hypothetical protein
MSVRPARPRAVSVKTFTLIHGGGEIDDSRAAEILDAASEWAGAEPDAAGAVEVWGPVWGRLLAGCLATAAAGGGPLCVTPLPAADDLVAGLKALGVPVRYRQVRQSAVADAELRAISQGWPVRYL